METGPDVDEWIEPDLALKIGPFSCFCACVPRTAAPAGSALWKEERESSEVLDVSGSVKRQAEQEQEPEETSFVAAAANSSVGKPGTPKAPAEPAAAGTPRQEKVGLLKQVNLLFLAAVVPGDEAEIASDLRREAIIAAIEAFAGVLNNIVGSGKVGDKLTENTDKLRRCKADPSLKDYRPWLLSELPVHAPFKEYKGDSAFMGNLWVAWQLEFYVELFDNIQNGMESEDAKNDAFNRTLYNHFGLFERKSFQHLVALPERKKMIEKLRDKADVKAALEEIADFVRLGRPIVRFLLQMNEEADAKVKAERASLSRGRTW